jgi:aminoglycoside phosphotransferase (APT) family kinase protein
MPDDLPGLPAERVEQWLRQTLPDLIQDGPWSAEVISGGLSNITYRLRLPGGTVILRRPPLGDILPRAHDMRREYRILTALTPTAVPVPEPLALCTDPEVIGAVFYVMAEVPGQVFRSAADTERLEPRARAGLADALIRTLADLHAVNPDAAGLGDYGRRSGYCARQLRTWGEQWQRSRTRQLPDMDVLLAALADCLPEERESTIVHGDYRLDNTIVGRTGDARIVAVLDWELSTIGDPLADLGLALTYWHDAGDEERARIPVAAEITAKPGFPTVSELAGRYAALTGRDLGDLAFYLALGAMKLAVILEGVHARYLRGQTVGDGYDRAGIAVPILVARGLRILKHGAP